MRILYLDDSGSAQDPNQDYVVLGGVCISDSGVRWLSNEIENLARRIDPENPGSVEFHAVDIFSGKKHPWNQLPNKAARIETIKNVLHTLDNAFVSTALFAVAIQKSAFPNVDPMLMAYEVISQSFNNHLEYDCDPPEHGIIILDNTSHETGLLRLAREIRETGNRIGLQNRSIIEIPLFVDSKVSRLVQLADHVAYAVFRRYNADDITYFNIIEGRFFVKDGIVRSLNHRSNNHNCTCPACITRKR